jgi:hypothetical protein
MRMHYLPPLMKIDNQIREDSQWLGVQLAREVAVQGGNLSRRQLDNELIKELAREAADQGAGQGSS